MGLQGRTRGTTTVMAGTARPIFELTPQGPDASRAVARPLAQSGGGFVGEVVAGAVRTGLEHDGDRVPDAGRVGAVRPVGSDVPTRG